MNTQQIAHSIVQRLVDAGHVAYFAGGWVRDHLLNLPSSDIDIATSASPDQVAALFTKTIPVGIAFGSVVVVEDSHQFEVTTFRTEGPYLDGRHPSSVAPGSAEEDAKRRSFTVNGMFYDPLNNQVIDFVEGQADLAAGIIRAIGNPDERFAEDKLRMIRAVRFAVRYDFQIEPATAAAIHTHAHELLPAVAVERIWQELQKMTGHPKCGLFLAELHRHHLLEQIYPELEGVSQEEIELRLAPLAHYPPNSPTIAYLTALFPHPTEAIGLRLKASRSQLQFLERQQELSRLLKEGTAQQLVHFYALDDAPLLLEIESASRDDRDTFLAHHRAEQNRLAQHIERKRTGRPLVNSDHLKRTGVAPGPQMGELLREAERIAIEEDLDDPEAVITRLPLPPSSPPK